MKQLSIILVLFYSISSLPSMGQNASVQDCLGAIPICQEIYTETDSPTGSGDVLEINGQFNCMQVESNSVWYTFTVNATGEFGFLLTPNNAADDYDWALFDITAASCSDLFDTPNLIVSCNAAGGPGCVGPTGATGATSFDNQGFGCGFNPPSIQEGFSTFNDLVPVVEGNTYVLCVSNWTGSSFGYTIDFGLSTGIGIFDEEPPALENVELSSDCSGETLVLIFSEPLQCATIETLNFQLIGYSTSYNLDLTSASCALGANAANDFVLSIDPPLQEGLHRLMLTVNGISEALDLCGNPASSILYEFDALDLLAPANLGPDTVICAGEPLLLDVFAPNITGYQWQDGSIGPTFTVVEPGMYSVTINNECGSTSDEILIDFAPSIEATLESNSFCASAPLVWDVSSPDATYLWQDGSTTPQFTVTQAGTYAVTITTDCEEIVLSTEVEEVAQAPNVVFDVDNLLCSDISIVSLDASTEGATYLWQDGSIDPVFNATVSGNYAVTVTNGCGVDEASISLNWLPPLEVLPLRDTFICPGERIVFDVATEGASAYLWQDGAAQSNYAVTGPGSYSVSISNFCESQSTSILVTACERCDIYVPNVFSPNGDGINDRFRPFSDCVLQDFTMQVFNRWGALVYESSDQLIFWPGTFKGEKLNSDIYIWRMQFNVLENEQTRNIELSGDVLLLN